MDRDDIGQEDIRREAYDWLLRLTSGEATQEDARAFRAWCARSPAHQRTFAECRRLWQTVGDAMPEEAPANAAAVSHYSRRAFLGRALFGSVVVGAGLLMVNRDVDLWRQADFKTAVGEQRSLRLSDLAVELNTGTRLNADLSSTELARLELLAGEAEIQARHAGREVILNVQGGSVLAVAADFNVRADGDGACVTCLYGSLVVGYRGANRTLLPNQQLVLANQRLGEVRSVDPEVVSAWRRQLLIFNDEPLSQVIAEINRYRPGRLILTNEALGRRRVQARFTLGQLPEVARLIRDAYGATITNLPGNVVLLG